jgi:hypothetical protein
MPTPELILSRLSRAATDLVPLAFVWHGLLLTAAVALLAGWRPARRTAACLLTAPLASVTLVAIGYRVIANAIVFGVAAAALLAVAMRMPDQRTERTPGAATVGGAALLATSWLYPHFLEQLPVATYLYGAPLGVVPCPTLMAVVGFTLIGGGLRSRAWSLTLAGLGLLYGVVGAAWLGVSLDAILVAGAAALAASVLLPRPLRGRDAPDDQRRLDPDPGDDGVAAQERLGEQARALILPHVTRR